MNSASQLVCLSGPGKRNSHGFSWVYMSRVWLTKILYKCADPNGGPNGHIQGSFLCHLPTPIEVSESPETSPPGSISSPPHLSFYKPPPPMYPYQSHAR